MFTNTPDILHESLQRGGPAMFAIRAALHGADTVSALVCRERLYHGLSRGFLSVRGNPKGKVEPSAPE